MRRSPTITALPLLPLLAGCYAAPELGEPRQATTGLQRLFASDLSTSGFARRTQSITLATSALADEPGRVGALVQLPPTLVAAEVARGASLPARTGQLVGDEVQRLPNLDHPAFDDANPDHVAQRIADGLATVPVLLGLHHRPLGEIDDRRHRTDPADDRPEAGFWQRLARRLGL